MTALLFLGISASYLIVQSQERATAALCSFSLSRLYLLIIYSFTQDRSFFFLVRFWTCSPHLALLSQISVTVQYGREHPQRGVTRLALVILHPEQPPHHQLDALNLKRRLNRTDTADETRDIYLELKKENSDSSMSWNNTLWRGYDRVR